MHKNRRQIFISIFFLFAYWLSGLTFIVGINDQKKGGDTYEFMGTSTKDIGISVYRST